METRCAGWYSFGALDLLTADRQRVDGNIVALGVQVGRVELAGPGVVALPPGFLVARVIENSDVDCLAGDLTVDDLLAPVEQPHIVGEPPLQRDIADFGEPRQLADVG